MYFLFIISYQLPNFLEFARIKIPLPNCMILVFKLLYDTNYDKIVFKKLYRRKRILYLVQIIEYYS